MITSELISRLRPVTGASAAPWLALNERLVASALEAALTLLAGQVITMMLLFYGTYDYDYLLTQSQ